MSAGTQIEARLLPTTADVSRRHELPVTPPLKRLRDTIDLLIKLQGNSMRFLDLEESITGGTTEETNNVKGGLIAEISYRVPTDPKDPNRIVHLGLHRFLGFHMDDKSKEWRAKFQEMRDSRLPPMIVPIENLVLS
jgi:hypothetical protein